MSRGTFRVIWIVAFAIALAVIVIAVARLGFAQTETWAVVAAALAVITSMISSWSSQRALELQEDAQRPYPYPSIDVKSRYLIMQLRVTNFGGSAARDIRLTWHKPVLNAQGNEVRFTEQDGVPEIPVLLPNESVAVFIGGSRALYEQYQDMNYSGEIAFSDTSGNKMTHAFYLSAEPYRSGLVYEQEEQKTHIELQKIPKELEELRHEVEQLTTMLRQPPDPNEEAE